MILLVCWSTGVQLFLSPLIHRYMSTSTYWYSIHDQLHSSVTLHKSILYKGTIHTGIVYIVTSTCRYSVHDHYIASSNTDMVTLNTGIMCKALAHIDIVCMAAVHKGI